jgi:predicted metal-dependent phosphoesterase TrpH
MHSLSESLKGNFRADLHTHSSCSDGSMTPEELIDLAVAIGLQGLSITDHDTIDAYKTAVPYAISKGLLLGTGVELSCEYKKKSVHILAYNFSLEDEGLIQYCLRQQQKRMKRNQEILERLKRVSILLTEEELLSKCSQASSIGRPHIAALMMQKGYVRSIQEAFQLYLGDGAPCFARGEIFTVKEALSVIAKAGGKSFLAHPHLYSDAGFVKEIVSLGFDGLECFYGRFSHIHERTWLKIVKEKKILLSGGSDFHGSIKPNVSLGCSYVDFETFSSIFTKED